MEVWMWTLCIYVCCTEQCNASCQVTDSSVLINMTPPSLKNKIKKGSTVFLVHNFIHNTMDVLVVHSVFIECVCACVYIFTHTLSEYSFSLSLLTGMNVLVIHIQLTLCVMATVVSAAPCYTFFS